MRIFGIGLALLLGVLLLLLFSAGSWLETETGRSLLQRELSRSLGMDANLQGDYSLEIIPGIHIAGRELVLKDELAGLPIASLDSYELRLALWPLLRKQVDIHKVALNRGSLDLDVYSAATAKSAGDSGTTAALPRIRSLDVSELRLLRSAEEFLFVEQLSVKDFAEGKASPIDFSIQLAGTPSPGGLQLAGTFALKTEPFEILLMIAESNLEIDGQAWPLGHGQLTWDGSQELLTGNIESQHFGFETRVKVWAQLSDSLLIQLSLEAMSPLGQLLSASLELVPGNKEWLVNDLSLGLDGQSVMGKGCFSTEDLPVVQLQLRSARLDLDALSSILPSELLASDQDGGIPSELDSPINLRVELLVEELKLDNAIARDVRLLLGSEPACFDPDQIQSESLLE